MASVGRGRRNVDAAQRQGVGSARESRNRGRNRLSGAQISPIPCTGQASMVERIPSDTVSTLLPCTLGVREGSPYPKTRPSGQHPRRQFLRLAIGAAVKANTKRR